MSDSITTGDLVMIIRPSPCCGSMDDVGKIFKVSCMTDGNGSCAYCGASHGGLRAHNPEDGWFYRTSRLKKIKPLDERQEDRVLEELFV